MGLDEGTGGYFALLPVASGLVHSTHNSLTLSQSKRVPWYHVRNYTAITCGCRSESI